MTHQEDEEWEDETWIPESIAGRLLAGVVIVIANVVLFPITVYDNIKRRFQPAPKPPTGKPRKAHSR